MKQEMPARRTKVNKSHERQILDYMEKHGSITSMEAIRAFRCTRLAARISDLKRHGHQIKRDMVEVKDHNGDTTRVAKYYLVKEVEA